MAGWRRSLQRPFYKGLIDGLVFVILLALAVGSLVKTGVLRPESGRYVAIDGDSLRKDGSELRLHGIDAPELQQNCANRMGGDYPCGREAQRALAKLIGGKELTCLIHETDRYGRGVATCSVNGVEINAELVRSGWAMAYRRHSWRYGDEEAEARRAERGIWQGDFDDPALWREANRGSLTGAGLSD
jgi:endonuclease YncB( thermonuclease family)